MQADWIGAATGVGAVAVDPSLGNLRALSFEWGGRRIAPLHSAPWVGEPGTAADEGLLPIERCLAGDFFCAPFGASDVEAAPAHGWSANSAWELTGRAEDALSFRLVRTVMGAAITKSLRLAADAPLLYQEHTLTGGSGALTVAHHPMIAMQNRAWFSCSPKRAVLTPEQALEPGRNRLATGLRSEMLEAVPAADGGTIDLTDLPIGTAHEDFVTLVEAPDVPLGWSALVREAEEDVIFVLKDPRVLPVTMLWHSNGGRDYPPWNGRHQGVLGIEDGCAAGVAGHRAALGPNPVAAEGVATALPLAAGRSHRIAHVIGAIPRPAGWGRVTAISAAGGRLTLTGDDGGTVDLPFERDFFEETR